MGGMRRVLAEAAPVLLIEVHHEVAAKAVWDRLTSAGYALFDVGRRRRRVESAAHLRAKAHLLARVP